MYADNTLLSHNMYMQCIKHARRWSFLCLSKAESEVVVFRADEESLPQ